MSSPSSEESIPPPHGIYVPVPTFFVSKSASNYNADAASHLDLTAQAKHSIHMARCGIKGLVLLGSTGEAIMVTNAERITLLKHVRQELDSAGYHNYPLIAGIATQCIADTIQQLRDASSSGCQWGMVLAPGYFASAVSQEGLIAWYNAVADQSPIPILIYHYPGVTNNLSILPATFRTLASHRNIVGCKLSLNDLSLHTQIALSPCIDHKLFATFTGFGQQLLPVYTVGGAGAIDALAGIFPRTLVKLWETTKSGDLNKAKRIQEIVCRGEELVGNWGVSGVKEGVRRILNIGDRNGTRLPLKGAMPELEWAKYEEVMNDLKMIETASNGEDSERHR